ncbi:hypothetical protein P4B35_11410 [Pontiellaceae bacterium B12227]|nr:hypothetical protein [Pontiellaceae bacterium B12227]
MNNNLIFVLLLGAAVNGLAEDDRFMVFTDRKFLHLFMLGKPPVGIDIKIRGSGSGYIAGANHDSILVETPVENVLAMFDAIEEYSI